MKKFKSVTEWMETNPSEEEQVKVLNLVNRGLHKQMRTEVYQKEKELKKYEKLANQMSELELPLSDEVKAKIKDLKNEIEEIRKELPEPRKRSKKEENSR